MFSTMLSMASEWKVPMETREGEKEVFLECFSIIGSWGHCLRSIKNFLTV
jgi:hypothetical protein